MGLERDPEATKSDPKGSPKGLKNKVPQKDAKMTPKSTQNGPFLDPKSTLGSLWGALGMLWGALGVLWERFGMLWGRLGGFLQLSLSFLGNAQDAFFLSRSFFARCFSPLAAAAAVRRRPPRAAKTVVKKQLHKSRI